MNITWATLIINAVIALMSAGSVGWIVTVREDKRAKKLENRRKELEIEEHKKDEIIKDWKDIAEERQKTIYELKEEVKTKDDKISEKDVLISDLKAKLDDRNTYCAVSELMKCTDIQCASRKPPFASSIVTSDKAIDNYIKALNEN